MGRPDQGTETAIPRDLLRHIPAFLVRNVRARRPDGAGVFAHATTGAQQKE